MADEEVNSNEEAPETETHEEDPIVNMKAEFSRKTKNLEAQQAETQAQLAAILAEVQKQYATKDTPPAKSARELIFDEPENFVKMVREEAVREASESVNRQYQASQAVQNAVSSMQRQFPEFSQEGSEASKLAIEYAAKLPAKLKGSAEGAELAMARAAQELGLVAASRRKTSVASEEPQAGSRSGSTSTAGSRKPASAGKIDKDTLALADLFGMDLKDPKFMATLEAASNRKNYKKYE